MLTLGYIGIALSARLGGFQTHIRSANGGEAYYEVKAINARGQVTESVRGDNAAALTTQVEWDPLMGRLRSIRSGVNGALQDWQYDDAGGSGYDPNGNLKWRKDRRIDREERFGCDSMNRLTSSDVFLGVGLQAVTGFQYDLLGNLTHKGDQLQQSGTYLNPVTNAPVTHSCPRTGRHFLTVMQQGSSQTIYCYDANGNQISASASGSPAPIANGDRRISYTVHDKPCSIQKVGQGANQTFTRYRYGPNHELVRRSDGSGPISTDTVVHYVGNVEVYRKPDAGGQVQRREYKLNLGGFLITNLKRHIETASGGIVRTSTRRYLLQDKLGSTDVMTDKSGVVVQRMSFDVWGQRRADIDWNALTAQQIREFNSQETRKGYTGHEMVDASNLIHMGGRIYDPFTARFLNADIHVQAPNLTQSYNRYAYVLNNPMNYTDPSGYSWLSKNWRSVASVAIAVFAPYAAGYLQTGLFAATKLTIGQAVFTGMVSGGIGSGSLRGALTGGLSAGLMHGVGSHFEGVAGGNSR